MATIRRDIAPGKGKMSETLSAPKTVLTKSNPNSTPSQRRHITSNLRPTLSSTKDDVSKQQGTKPISTLSIHKPTLTTRSRPALDKSTPSTQKTRPSTISTLRSSSASTPGRPSAAQKPVPGKNLKAVGTKDQAENPRSLMHATTPVATTTIKKSSLGLKKTETGNTTSARKKEITTTTPLKSVRSPSVSKVRAPQKLPEHQESSITAAELEKKVLILSSNEKVLMEDHAEKRHSLQTMPVNSTVKKSSNDIQKQETANNTSPAKEQIITTPPKSVENPDISRVPEPEMIPDQESSVTASDQDQNVQVSNNDEKGTDEFMPDHQEPLKVEETEGGTKGEDTKVVSDEASTVLRNQDAPLVIETQESEQKHVEETEKHSMKEIDSSNTDQSLAENSNEEAEEKEADEVEVLPVVEEKKEEVVTEVAEKDKVVSESAHHESKETEKDEMVSESAHHESKETDEQVVVEEIKQQEPEKAAPKQNQATQGKKDSAVSSNHVIKETANKLREQRQNRVRALAGAFETVISLQ